MKGWILEESKVETDKTLGYALLGLELLSGLKELVLIRMSSMLREMYLNL